MKTTPPKRKRLRRWLLWVGLPAVVLFVGLPTAAVLHTRYQVSLALHSASAVRLEEHSFSKVLSTQVLTSTEFSDVTDAMPFTLDIGIPGVIAYCFIPHHRVVFTDVTQHETTFEVCFTCNQMRFSGNGLLFTPLAWRQPLRQLFLRHNIPVRESYPGGL